MSEDESCFDKKCKDCPDHAEAGGKIVCNKDNRLGLRAKTVDEFFFGDKK